MKDVTYVFRNSLPYYKKILWILIVCTIVGFTQMGILLLEPQIISLMVDRVITPALGGSPVKDSSIFSFLIEKIPTDHLWTIMGVLIGAFLFLLLIYFLTFYARWNIVHYFSLQSENRMSERCEK